ncbi:GNAT family N-acetyltransferase [Bacillus sp. OTU530]|uniref:GNAT family N-acetyltransferase n=1 Tax=Bacillus sp. OTU530 TaxID=3043862 RepID=UPI00313C2F2A
MEILFDELRGDLVRIVPMERYHVQGLYESGKERDIWTHLPRGMNTLADMQSFVEEALKRKRLGEEFPFVILLRENNKVLGTTRFLGISRPNKSVEIGWTWLNPSVWGTNINTECKYLLLEYCFETLGIIRVQFKTDERNLRSQKAIERIGGVKEGVLRNHMIRQDGSYRNSVFYSIIEQDWATTKAKIKNYLESKRRI